MANLQSAYGLDQPIWAQYVRYIRGAGARRFRAFVQVQGLHGDGADRPGISRSRSSSARSPSCWRCVLGIPIGTFAALHHNSAGRLRRDVARRRRHCDSLLRGAAVSRPVVRHLPALAAGGRLGTRLDSASCSCPSSRLALPPLAYIARLTRGGMLEVLRSHFIRTAIAKGLPLRTVILRHALRPALVPVAGYLAPAVASIMTGSLVVESIAGLPGSRPLPGARRAQSRLHAGDGDGDHLLGAAHRHGARRRSACMPGSIRASGSTGERSSVARGGARLCARISAQVVALWVIAVL